MALNRELDRLRLGDAYRPPITLDDLCERFLEQYIAAPVTVKYARVRLQRARDALGGVQASDVTSEALSRLMRSQPVGDNFKHDQVRTLRAVYRFGLRAKLVNE